MSSEIGKNRAIQYNKKGYVVQTVPFTEVCSQTRHDYIHNVPTIIKGQEYTLDVGSFQLVCDTFGISYKEKVEIVNSEDPSGDAARGKNACNANLAALLLKQESLELVEVPHQDYAEMAKKSVPSSIGGAELKTVPLTSLSAITEQVANIGQFVSKKIASKLVFQQKAQVKLAAEAVTEHNKNIQKILEDIFDEKTVKMRWGAQLASPTTMWGIKRTKGCSLTRQEIINTYLENDAARYAYACML